MSSKIAFVDLQAQHEQVRREIEAAIHDIIDHSSFIGGNYVSAFEREFADYIGVKEAIGVANGTDALWLSLLAIGVGVGDAVITVPNTFIATVEAITRCGAFPIFVDINLDTATIDVHALKALFENECTRDDSGAIIHRQTGHRIAAILPVHLYGLPVDLKALMEIAATYDLPVVEDACQAHGARYCMDGEWKRAGSFGIASAFSFYPGKNLGAMGDAGAVVTNDPELAKKMRWLRDHGSSEKYIHVTSQGWNSRLDAIQAAVLSIKLKKLDEWNYIRRQRAGYYREVLADLPLELPAEPDYAEHVYHLFVVRTLNRDYLQRELSARGVGVGLHYPVPLHLQKAYEYMGFSEGSFPNSELSANTGLSLPMHPALTKEQIDNVAEACREILLIGSKVN
jgi:dTDP-4-amino-4,6-dideoxygalactose transaminase